MYIRDYCIHLINGEKIVLPGEYNAPVDRTIPGKFKEALPDDVITFGDPDIGYFYIPKKLSGLCGRDESWLRMKIKERFVICGTEACLF